MEDVRQIQKLEQLKVLGDERRLAILRALMASLETLSSLGKIFGEHPAQIRHHLKQLEQAGLVELVETRPVRGFLEKYYRATARAYVFSGLILPAPPDPDQETVVFLGSHDLAFELVTRHFRNQARLLQIISVPIGSLDGLIALRQGSAHLAGCHLWDEESGDYNLPFVRRFFPDRPVRMITLAHREQGLIVPAGNPGQIRSVTDLARPDLVLINRNPGSGTRIWLDHQLQQLGISSEQVHGYQQAVATHTGVAEAIAAGLADVGLGLQAAARQYQLDFVPLFQERYDLVIPENRPVNAAILPLYEFLQSKEFRQAVAGLGGYDTSHSGEELPV